MDLAQYNLTKALTCLSEPTRLNIAMHFGRDNPANITRRIYKVLPNESYTNNQYNRILHHLKRMETVGVIAKCGMADLARTQDYELTLLGKEALKIKGYR